MKSSIMKPTGRVRMLGESGMDYTITFGYPRRPLLFEHLKFAIGEQRIIALCGHNGVGKTTLLKLLTGILPLQDGSFIDVGISKWFLPSAGGLLGNFSLREHLSLVRSLVGGALPQSVDEAISSFDAGEFIDNPVESLSSGEYTKASLIVMLANSPQFLLLDEPFAFLDPKASVWLCDSLKKMPGNTIVFSSHDLHMVSELSDRCLILKKGRIAWDSETESIPLSHDRLQAAYEAFS